MMNDKMQWDASHEPTVESKFTTENGAIFPSFFPETQNAPLKKT